MTSFRVALFLLLAHAVLLAHSILTNFVVIDECGHLAAGIDHWRSKRFTAYRVNPPLPRMLAALPLLPDAPAIGWDWDDFPGFRPEFGLGRQLAFKARDAYFPLAVRARCVAALWAMLAAVLVWRWAAELHGEWGGLLALALWCFEPTVLAFGSIVGPDMPATAVGLAACWAFTRYLRQPSFDGAFICGLLLGLGLLCKFTLLLLPIAWVLLALWKRPPWQAFLILLVALLVVNIGYGFDQTGKPLGEFQFVSRTLSGADPSIPIRQAPPGNRFAGTWLASIPVPVPADVLRGLDIQRRDFEGAYRSYLRGEWRSEGWWHYYLYAMAVKMPLGTLALLMWGLLHPRRDLLIPALVFFVFVSSQTGMSHHPRYVLPAWPFLFIMAGGVVKSKWRWLAVPLLLWSMGRMAWHAPQHLTHFNELGGGAENGLWHLTESSTDWGQDLLRLKAWLDERDDARPLHLAYWGFVDPAILGIRYRLPPPAPAPGLYIVSVNFVVGGSLHAPDGEGGLRAVPFQGYAWFRQRRPAARIGAMLVYDLR